MDPEKRDRLDRLFEHYESESPEKNQIEGDRGGFYPKEIDEPDIAFVPLAEPHVIITDLYDDPQEWYNIRELNRRICLPSLYLLLQGIIYCLFSLFN